jgi:hypothetical protein
MDYEKMKEKKLKTKRLKSKKKRNYNTTSWEEENTPNIII